MGVKKPGAQTVRESDDDVEVLCYGEALVDRLGPLGGDPATDGPVDDRLGGAPANVACALARLGTPTAFLGRLGRDDIGTAFDALFTERGINTQALQWDDQRPSRIVLVRRDASGDREFHGFAGDKGQGFADQAVCPDTLSKPLGPMLEKARWLLVGTLPLASPTSGRALRRAVDDAKAKAVPVALDINWRPTFWSLESKPSDGPSTLAVERIRPFLQESPLLKLAAEEAEWFFGTTDPVAVSQSLPHKPAVLITDGGSKLRWSVGAVHGSMPAFSVKAVDTTGAGDSFMAGLLHRLCKDPDLLSDTYSGGGTASARVKEAITFAAGCGALVCQGAGAIDPQPVESQVMAFLKTQSSSGAR